MRLFFELGIEMHRHESFGINKALTVYSQLDSEQVLMIMESDEVSEGATWLNPENSRDLVKMLRGLIGYKGKPRAKTVNLERSVPFFVSLDEDLETIEIKLKRRNKPEIRLSFDETESVIKKIESLQKP